MLSICKMLLTLEKTMLLLPTYLLVEIFFLESSEQKPLIRAHTLNSYTQLGRWLQFLDNMVHWNNSA